MNRDRATWSWRAAWSLIAIILAALDLRNEEVDTKAGRTHVTGTTFSCFCRWVVSRTPGGRTLFTVGLIWFCLWFRSHILDHVDAQRVRWRLR